MSDETKIVVGACYRGRAGVVVRVIGLDADDGLVTFVPLDSTLARVGLAPSGLGSVCSIAMFAHMYSVRVPDPTPAVVEDLTVRELGERLIALDTFIRAATWTPGGPWNVLGERHDEDGERHFVNGTGSTLEAAALDMLAQMAAHVASEDGGK